MLDDFTIEDEIENNKSRKMIVFTYSLGLDVSSIND